MDCGFHSIFLEPLLPCFQTTGFRQASASAKTLVMPLSQDNPYVLNQP
ncbi:MULTISPECIES: hypothetical protein [Brevibacillus]|nr:hypothetical protein [Brevibacillus borstelensis]MED1853918.1 hypothetical protein [Brevibacillus borstelensis]MED2010522.1 hypothetical protein [Brevibacillus borstelensis]